MSASSKPTAASTETSHAACSGAASQPGTATGRRTRPEGTRPTEDLERDALSEQQAWSALEELDRELNRLQRTIRLAMQTKLGQLAGRSLGTLQANRDLARSLHRLLDSHGLRVRCNECGHPAILRVSPRRGSTAGAFVFDHSIDGRRTFHGGGGRMPHLHLVSKPSRRGAANGKKAGDSGATDSGGAADRAAS